MKNNTIKLNESQLRNIVAESVKKVLVELDHLAKLIGFSIKDLERATKIKRKIIYDRFNNEY